MRNQSNLLILCKFPIEKAKILTMTSCGLLTFDQKPFKFLFIKDRVLHKDRFNVEGKDRSLFTFH